MMPSTAFGIPQTTAWIVLIYGVAILAAAIALGAFAAIVVTALPRVPKLQGPGKGEPESASVPYAGRMTGCRGSRSEAVTGCGSSPVATLSSPAAKGFARRHVVAGPWGKR